MRPGDTVRNRTSIELLEEAVHLLRLSPLSSLGRYYIGTLPFILALLYFWTDMSHGALAAGRLIPASLILAFLYIWMKSWHSVFARFITSQIHHTQISGSYPEQFLRMAGTQSLVQATGLFILPLSLLFSLTGWCFAFYQNFSILDHGQNNVREIGHHSWDQAKLWPGQNHTLLLIIAFLGIFVFLNIAACLYFIPHLLNKILGFETLFTLGGQWSVLNTTFMVVTLSLTLLCLDPLLKVAYILRCFYGQSLNTGQDLKAGLKKAKSYKSLIPLLILLLGFLIVVLPETVQAVNKPQTGQNMESVSAEALDTSINQVLSRREFAWRMPRETSRSEPVKENLILGLLRWTGNAVKKIFTKIGEWFGKFYDWLKKFFPQRPPPEEGSANDWVSSRRYLLIAFLAVLSVLTVFILWRIFRRDRGEPISANGIPVFSQPDLTDDRTKADDLPVNHWLMLAEELMKKGNRLLALRAFYLATLAHLADRGLITIQGYKSNRDYEAELRRRAHEHGTLISLFSKTVTLFDRSWYGLHDVTREMLACFISNQERIMTFDQK